MGRETISSSFAPFFGIRDKNNKLLENRANIANVSSPFHDGETASFLSWAKPLLLLLLISVLSFNWFLIGSRRSERMGGNEITSLIVMGHLTNLFL